MIAEYRYAPFTGLYLPDSSAETPEGSLAKATNVDVTDSGGIRQRYGTGISSTSHVTEPVHCFTHAEGSTNQFAVLHSDGSGRFYVAGTSKFNAGTAITGGPTSASGSAQMLRSPTSSSNPDTYIASAGNVLYRWDGSAMTSVANAPKCRLLTQGLNSERLFAAGFTAGTNGPAAAEVNPSTVHASDPGDPEVWTADVKIDFTPGDGEDITGLCAYNNQVIVFKKSRFFVIYGEQPVDATVEFLYHEVSGAGLARKGAYTVTPVGVFFLSDDGVYLTTGTTPQKVSRDIQGLFTGDLPSWTDYGRLLPLPDNSLPKMTHSKNTLYLTASNVSDGGAYSTVILAYDWQKQSWSYYTRDILALSTIYWPSIQDHIAIGIVRNAVDDYRAMTMHPSLRDDEGTNIPVDAQLNWFRPESGEGSIGMDDVMVLRMDAWGVGKVQAGAQVDYQAEPADYHTIDFGEMAAGDVWGDGTDLADVWGDGSDPDDVWSASAAEAEDLLRLSAPTHKYARNFAGRGQFLSLRLTKMPDSEYFYLERPRLTLIGR